MVSYAVFDTEISGAFHGGAKLMIVCIGPRFGAPLQLGIAQ
jgi:hypothetical protein